MTGSVRKKGKYFHAIIELGVDEHGKRMQKSISTKCKNKTEAKIVLREILRQMEMKMYVDRVNKTFAQFIVEYIERIDVEQTTYEGYLSIVNNHIVPYFNEKQTHLQDIEGSHLQEYIDIKLRNGLASSTLNRHLSIFKCSLGYAVQKKLILNNPALEVDIPKQTKRNKKAKDKKTYKPEEIKKLWTALEGNKIFTAVYLASILGLRRGEILGLRWSDIDFENGTLSIQNTRTKVSKTIEKGPKSDTSIRTFPLSAKILEHLQKLKEKQKEDEEFYGNTYRINDYVVKAQNGKPISTACLNENFSKFLKENGFEHIRLHDLRHSIATIMVKHNISLDDIQSFLGHANLSTTLIYLHGSNKIKTATTEKVQRIFDNLNPLEELLEM